MIVFGSNSIGSNGDLSYLWFWCVWVLASRIQTTCHSGGSTIRGSSHVSAYLQNLYLIVKLYVSIFSNIYIYITYIYVIVKLYTYICDIVNAKSNMHGAHFLVTRTSLNTKVRSAILHMAFLHWKWVNSWTRNFVDSFSGHRHSV